MCGICGFSSEQHPVSDPAVLLGGMTRVLAHRGPDGVGLFHDGPVGLGHTRLAIIDLSGGHQPLFNEDRSLALVCNGEIYNYETLRRQLRAKGHCFETKSDSEVILHLWEDHGPKCVDHLRGMFAFALYDQKQHILFGARDRFGQKPFFYVQQEKNLAFASEIKALLTLPWVSRELDLRALDQFLFYQYIPNPNTLFAGIRQLPPAHWLLWRNNQLTVQRYWQNSFPDVQPGAHDETHLEGLEKSLMDAVSSHLVSDVPVGLFLSGGIDSSLVGALAMRAGATAMKSFCIAFPGDKNDESHYAKTASAIIGSQHYEFPFEPSHLAQRIETLIHTFDQPIADPAALPLAFLSERAAQHVKVVLTGDGGDELFAGYEKYQDWPRQSNFALSLARRLPGLFATEHLAACAPDPFFLKKLRSRFLLQAIPAARGVYHKNVWEGWDRYALFSDRLREALHGMFTPPASSFTEGNALMSPLNSMLAVDQQGYLPGDLLIKTDFATMAYGLEARAPFLDHILAQTAASLPAHLLATPQETKVALRRIAARFLPAELVQRRKRGFSVPLQRWFRHELKSWLTDLLLKDSVTVPKYFRPALVRRILAEHAQGKENHKGKIYTLVVFELWYRKYLG